MPDDRPGRLGKFRPLWLAEAAVAVMLAFALTRAAGWRVPGVELTIVPVVVAGALFGFWVGAGAGLVAALAVLAEHGARAGDLLAVGANREAVPAAVTVWVCGAVVGFIGDTHRVALRRERSRAEDAEARMVSLSAQHGVVVEAKEALDRRVVGQVQTVSRMYEAAKALEVLDTDSILPATARLVAQFLEAEAVSIYTLEGFRLTLVASVGELPGRATTLTVDEGPLGTAVRTGSPAGVRAKYDYDRSRVLVAAPLKRPDGQVRAAIAVEKLPFAQLTPATTQLLELVADWAGRALANSEAYTQAQAASAMHPVTGVLRVKPLLERLHQEWAIARRYGLPLSVVLVRRAALLDEPAGRRAEAAVPVVQALKKLVRDVDLVGHYRTDDSFLLVLPQTDAAGGQLLADKLHERLQGLLVFAVANGPEFATPEAALQYLQVMGFDLQEV
ncbi:MAG: GGDEF domain-containing protein [Candidatus Sericytochromatia bacterium]